MWLPQLATSRAYHGRRHASSVQICRSARGSVNGDKQIGVCFLHHHTTKGQEFRANAALALSWAVCTNAYGDLAHPLQAQIVAAARHTK
jgi:hypothetical protein